MSEATPAGLFDVPQLDSLSRILNVIGSAGFWKRTGVVTAGLALVIIGTVIMVSGTRAVKEAASLVTGAATKVVTKGVV